MYIYAPAAFEIAKEKYTAALAIAKTSKNQNAGIEEAKQGLKQLSRAQGIEKRSREVLTLAYEMRSRALDAGAATHYSERAEEAEEDLIEAAKLVELKEE